jgi:hypothetical protein
MFGPNLREKWSGMPLNSTEDVARALFISTVKPGDVNGKSFWVGGGTILELEDKLHETQPLWLGKEMSDYLDEGQRRIVPNWEDVVLAYRKENASG